MLARQQDDYYCYLSKADMARQGDQDRRPSIVECTMIVWYVFFTDTCPDKVESMTRMLDLEELFIQRCERSGRPH
jgi:hypothetical protein